jgi:uncharacterized protein YceK
MIRTFAVVVGAATMTLLSGCGTFGDMLAGPIDDHVFYRGVRLDVEAAKEGRSNLILLADLPFSAVADTLLLPFALSLYGAVPEAAHRLDPGKQVRHEQTEKAFADSHGASSPP